MQLREELYGTASGQRHLDTFEERLQDNRQSPVPDQAAFRLDFPAWLRTAVRRWSRKAGLPLVSVGYFNGWADEQRVSAGPLEFASLVAGAQAVVTNFFHGCVFAMLYGKPWAAHPSDYRSIKIPDLASMLGAEDRLVDEATSEASLEDLLSTPLRASVASRIAERRERSDAFLDAALA